MKEVEFKRWLDNNGVSKKIQSDLVSRLRRIERELGSMDIDEQYDNDRCENLMALFENKGDNEKMKKYSYTSFPIGKYYMSTYRHSLKKYVQFRES